MVGRADEEIVFAARNNGAGRRAGIAFVDWWVMRGDVEGGLMMLADDQVVDDCSVDLALKCRCRVSDAAAVASPKSGCDNRRFQYSNCLTRKTRGSPI